MVLSHFKWIIPPFRTQADSPRRKKGVRGCHDLHSCCPAIGIYKAKSLILLHVLRLFYTDCFKQPLYPPLLSNKTSLANKKHDKPDDSLDTRPLLQKSRNAIESLTTRQNHETARKPNTPRTETNQQRLNLLCTFKLICLLRSRPKTQTPFP